MKLITEYNDNDLSCTITEGTKGGKNYVIEGIFMQANRKNRNGRIYEDKVMRSAVDKYIEEQVATGRAVGELNHPDGPTINLDKVSHRITELYWKGDDIYGKAQILDTPMGQVVKGLLDGGVKLGVSSRGMGSLERREGNMYVGEDFHLTTVDIVQDPSAPSAFVNGIMEGVDYFFDSGRLVAESVVAEHDRVEESLNEDIAIKEFKDFLNSL